MVPITIHQLKLGVSDRGEIRWLAASPEIHDDWRHRAEEIVRAFGQRPEGVLCPEAVLVQPIDKEFWTVCQVADLGGGDDVPPALLGFHFLILRQSDYRRLGGDPFALLDHCPIHAHQRGSLPTLHLELAAERRTVDQVCTVLKRSDGPMLLGAAQALVDGCRIAWVRDRPDTSLLRSLWTLLPTSTRSELFPASFAFSNSLQFDALIVPVVDRDQYDRRYLSEQQAEYYPEGRYELGVQTAAEAGDQHALDQLFARRSRAEVWRLGWWLLGALIILAAAMALFRR